MSFLETIREKNKGIDIHCGNCAFPSHFHKNLEFLYPLEKKVTVVLNNQRLEVEKNCLLIIDSFAVHHILGSENAVSVCLPVECLDDFFAYKKEREFGKKILPDPDRTLLAALQEFKNLNDKNFLIKKGKINCFLGNISNLAGFKPSLIGRDDIVKKAIIFLNENYRREELNLELVAEKIGYSKFTLSHKFRSATGMDIREYLTELRLNEFIGEAEHNKMSDVKIKLIDAIMDNGFQSIQTFYRVFKKRFGVTPHQYLTRL